MSDQTKVLKCSCKHDFQDKYYGKGLRLHNFGPKCYGFAVRGPGWRCTVCGKTKEV